jgi:hypothetical protein
MPPRKLWQRRLADGSEVEACLWHDRSLGEATCEIEVRAPTHSDDLAANIANAICRALDERGAVPIEGMIKVQGFGTRLAPRSTFD